MDSRAKCTLKTQVKIGLKWFGGGKMMIFDDFHIMPWAILLSTKNQKHQFSTKFLVQNALKPSEIDSRAKFSLDMRVETVLEWFG